MDEFTSRIEELNSKFTVRKSSTSQQNLAMQGEACNGSAPTSLFMTGLGNGTLTGSILPNSSSSNQLAKDFQLIEEVRRSLINNLCSYVSFSFPLVLGLFRKIQCA